MATLSFSRKIVITGGKLVSSQGNWWRQAGGSARGHSSVLLTSSSSCVMPEREKRKDERLQKNKQYRHLARSLHATAKREIVIFIPEIVVGGLLVTGWYLYRKSQGKPLKPDGCQQAQNTYKQLQNEKRERNARYQDQRQQ
mmetsp:Transcript_12265/g.16053  ORF Transcript_12265/g.16053 Transcript_12265/m.16053 type:complete len:141 (+) Transcript_12265:25-447(+)